MKKAVYILIAISCICSTAIALYDSDTDVKYLQLFTNNGKDVIKEYEHIDSITYSKYDKDGVKQDSYMTQEIWTKDSVYRNPLLSIDSLKVDKQLYYVYCSDIQEFIAENIKAGEDEESVKGKIENYLSNSSSVMDFSFDETGGYYSIEFDNGGRADITLFNMEDAYSANKPGKLKNNINKSVISDSHYDVSYIEGEEIQDNNRLLYLWAGEFWTMENFYPRSEIDGIKEAIDNSPVDIKVEVVKNDVSILDRFNDYGAIVISQTHGRGDGAFFFCSRSWVNNLGDNDKFNFYRNYVISLLQRKVVDMVFPWFYYTVTPQYFTGKSFDYPFIYGNYCWSRGLGITGIYNSCFVGYDVASNFLFNDDMSISYFNSLSNGQTHQKSVDNIGGYAFQNNWVEPATNHNKPDKRYFSISMNDVEDKGNGKFVISGKINGFKNLKKDIELRLYYETYGIDPDLESVKFINLHVDTEGNFREEFLVSDHIKNGTGGELKFQIAFKYNTNYYYGEIKSSGTKKGTKWLKMEIPPNSTIRLKYLGLHYTDIVSVQGAEVGDNYVYIPPSSDGSVLIEYKGKMRIAVAGASKDLYKIKCFITNDTIQFIRNNAFYALDGGISNLEVFECAAVDTIDFKPFGRAPLKRIDLSGIKHLYNPNLFSYNKELEYISISGSEDFLMGDQCGCISHCDNLKEVKLNVNWKTPYRHDPAKGEWILNVLDHLESIRVPDKNYFCPECDHHVWEYKSNTIIFLPDSVINMGLNYYDAYYRKKFIEHMGNSHESYCSKYKLLMFPISDE